jgi:hypothetical protein
MPLLILGVIAIVILAAVGRGVIPLRIDNRAGPNLLALAAAFGAIVAALRGLWIPSLGLIGASLYLGAAGRRTPKRAERPEAMDLDEARRILGVAANADRAEIESAYRRLMLRAHPDQGGSTGLAAQLNAARDRLLKRT